VGSAYTVLVLKREDKGLLSMDTLVTKDCVKADREAAVSPC